MPSNHLILCHPLILPPSIFPSIRVFSNKSALRIRWPKYWRFSFIICPSNEYPGLISFRMDWLDLLAVRGTLESPLQHHSLKASCVLGGSILKANTPQLAGTPSLPRLNTEAKRVPHSDPTICASLVLPNLSLHSGRLRGLPRGGQCWPLGPLGYLVD